ncbi:hypothetical protein AB0F88_08205 [Streptosporangium sp. NPDC023963]|uniref:hypothetical protein n=1 Tax=Streptosporangium sp. NPDC023963 TaxID=3155608 RepID=UPI00341AF7D3
MHAAPGQAVLDTASTALAQDDPVRNPVRKATILFERTTASKCPVTFRVHGSFEGLPDGAQLIGYRVVGTGKWRSVKVPANHGGAFTTVLQTFNWDWETEETSVQIEIKQPDGLVSNVLHYFKCGSPGEEGPSPR